MTGEALYGPHAGDKMAVSNLLQMNVSQALEMDPEMSIAISDHPFRGSMGARLNADWDPDDPDAQLNRVFVATLGEEDTRLDRMEMGLGVWRDELRRYYPVSVIRENGNYLFDEVQGQQLLVFLDPLTSTPTAIYWDSDDVTVDGRDILLGDGHAIRNGQVFSESGDRVDVERPQQMFTRWYGFSLTFPDPEIFE